MRTTQYLGLNQKAQAWLENHCEETALLTKKFVEGMFGEKVHQLRKHSLKTPKTIVRNPKAPSYLETHVEEYVQAEPWSSGPVIFLALRYSKCKQPVEASLWPEEEINNC
jgi:hypothetical protein